MDLVPGPCSAGANRELSMLPLEHNDVSSRAIRRISVRILPFIFILYITSYLDRANVAFAKLMGTPEGTGMSRGRFLAPGNRIGCWVEGLGLS